MGIDESGEGGFRDLDDLEAIAREHGGAPAFRAVPNDERLLGTIVRVSRDEKNSDLVIVEIGGEGLLEDVRVIVRRDHFQRMLEELD